MFRDVDSPPLEMDLRIFVLMNCLDFISSSHFSFVLNMDSWFALWLSTLPDCFFFVDFLWCCMIHFEDIWFLMIIFVSFWCWLIRFDLIWCILISVDSFLSRLIHFDLFWCHLIYFDSDARAIMLPMVIDQLIEYQEKMEDLQICIDIINDLLTTLTKPPEIVVWYCFSLVFTVFIRICN